jgi:trans-2,3-dihydro-3-hydroxyanthranilate isomerase
MTEYRFRIVDVFSERPLAGNGLCVVLDPFPEDLRQPLAREVNLSETTFPTVTGPGRYDVRIFTPGSELPYAGHPTLGTAWVLGPGSWEQTSPGATVTVEVDAEGARMSQPDPELTPIGPGPLVAALGLPGAEGAWRSVAGGLVHLLVATSFALGELAPEVGPLLAAARAEGGDGAAVVRRIDDAHLAVRVFMPGAGVVEDPGTGSAAGPLALLARRLWGTDVDVTIRQGEEMGRPCRIDVHAEEGAVQVGGRVTASAEGKFTL